MTFTVELAAALGVRDRVMGVDSPAELTSCHDLLVSARTAALWVATVLHGDGNAGAAARLRSIAAQLDSEIADIDRLLNAPQKP